METETVLTGRQAQDAVTSLGWRYLLGTLRTSVPVESLTEAARLAAVAVAACGGDADGHLRIDLRPDRAVIALQSLAHAAATDRDVELAHLISAAVRTAGLHTAPGTSPSPAPDTTPRTAAPHAVQLLELAIDALDIPAIRPFWKAVLAYADEADRTGPTDPLVDPVGQGPALWFQQLDAPRPQRNRIHFDLCVPHDEAPGRLEAAIAAGGRLLSSDRAPAFWVLADAEGNEICLTTWQGRDY